MAEDDALSRAKEKLRTRARQALSRENVRAALATKLVAVGLCLVCLAGGIDYFSSSEAIHHAVEGVAREAGQPSVATALEDVDEQVDDLKARAVSSLPEHVRDHLAAAALVLGVVAIGAGLRTKLRAAGEERGRVLRDVGRLIAGPGVVGIVAFVAISWHGAPVLRNATASFGRRVRDGISAGEILELAGRYALWAWTEVGGVLLLGIAFALAAVGGHYARERAGERWTLPLDVARRTAAWASALALGFYVCATLIAIVSYGGALRVVAWPWKTKPLAFLVALAFMAFGIGLAHAGTAEMRRRGQGASADAGC